jgi:hypothetical protein
MRLLISAILLTAAAFAQQAPRLYSNDGKGVYLGKLSANPYDQDSISNPYGKYGSPYSQNSVNNPYGTYGSPYSNYSATNPYATSAPVIVAPRVTMPALPTFPSLSTPRYSTKCCSDWSW